MFPSWIMTFMSLTQAPSMFLKVLLARAMACWTASSKPCSEIALISVTVATLMVLAHPLLGCPLPTTPSWVLATTSVGRLNLPSFIHCTPADFRSGQWSQFFVETMGAALEATATQDAHRLFGSSYFYKPSVGCRWFVLQF